VSVGISERVKEKKRMSEEGPPKLYTNKPRKGYFLSLLIFFLLRKKLWKIRSNIQFLIQGFSFFGNSATEAVSRTTEIERVLLAGGDGGPWPGCCSTAAAAAAKGTVCSAL